MKYRALLFRAFLLALGLGMIPEASHAQTFRQFKRHVEALLDNIQDAGLDCAHPDANDTDNDSTSFSELDNANAELGDYLLKTLPKMPQSLTMKFRDTRIIIASSSDHILRSWAWNTWEGGSMPQMAEYVEYKTDSGLKVVNPYEDQDGENDSWIRKFRKIQTQSGHTYYLAISGWIGDGMHHGEQADVYEIQGTNLNTKVPLFKTKKKTLSEISYYSATESENLNQFKLSSDGRTFLVPLALYKTKEDKEEDDVTLTRKSLKYVFDGKHFVYRGIVK